MCGGIALTIESLPVTEVEKLKDHIHQRDGIEEVRFHYHDSSPLLPVIRNNEFLVVQWGNRDNRRSRLHQTGWAKSESVELGKWKYLKPEEVIIPAIYGLEKGVWFAITEGMKGILVNDEQGNPHAYMLTQPASHYYNVMTRHERMPVFVGEQM